MSVRIEEPYADAEQTAHYVGVLAEELRTLAEHQELGFLAYLLAMVDDEAQSTVKRLSDLCSRARAA